MTQIQEKTGICKSVVIATVVAIRDVVKSGFHCSEVFDELSARKASIYSVPQNDKFD